MSAAAILLMAQAQIAGPYGVEIVQTRVVAEPGDGYASVQLHGHGRNWNPEAIVYDQGLAAATFLDEAGEAIPAGKVTVRVTEAGPGRFARPILGPRREAWILLDRLSVSAGPGVLAPLLGNDDSVPAATILYGDQVFAVHGERFSVLIEAGRVTREAIGPTCRPLVGGPRKQVRIGPIEVDSLFRVDD